MRRILFIAHSDSADGGSFRPALERRGFRVDFARPLSGESLDHDFRELHGCVVLGGPMSANDEHLPGIAKELRWLEGAIAGGLPITGICLGAQLLARVLGSRVWAHPEEAVEVGFHRIAPTERGGELFGVTNCFYQWHREGFDMPPTATALAHGGEAFPNQAFRYRERVYGFQFHPEMTPSTMSRWLSNGHARLSRPGAQAPDAQWREFARYDGTISKWRDRFLDRWLVHRDKPDRDDGGRRRWPD